MTPADAASCGCSPEGGSGGFIPRRPEPAALESALGSSGGARQRLLFESRVQRAFAAWIESESGRYVEREVIRLARELRAAGVDRYGIAGIWERLRWDQTVRVPGSAEWKLDNRYRSHLARKVMAEHADLDGLFRTRDLRGRA